MCDAAILVNVIRANTGSTVFVDHNLARLWALSLEFLKLTTVPDETAGADDKAEASAASAASTATATEEEEEEEEEPWGMTG